MCHYAIPYQSDFFIIEGMSLRDTKANGMIREGER
jgi:hypothetical protein